MLKKVLILCLALLMAFGCAGCNPKEKNPDKTPPVTGGEENEMSQPINLRTNNLLFPKAIDTNPYFRFSMTSDKKGQLQTAYQIQVAESFNDFAAENVIVWDSGKVESNQNTAIAYEGKTLKSATRYYWRVRTWDSDLLCSKWSETSFFDTGILSQDEWKGYYFDGNAPRYRKEFIVSKEIRFAKIYAGVLGLAEIYVNGVKAGDSVQDTNHTVLRERIFYNGYDITQELKQGSNVIAAEVANGALGRTFGGGNRQFIAQIYINYADGTSEMLVTDSSWYSTDISPLVATEKNNNSDGEKYDARLEQEGWDQPGFNMDGWDSVEKYISLKKPGELVLNGGNPVLTANVAPLTKVNYTIKPVSVTEIFDGKYIVDLGQNISGIAQIKVRNASEGDKIDMLFAEDITYDWTDYTVELKAKIVSRHAGIAFRVADENNYYYWKLTTTGYLNAYKVVDGEMIKLKDIEVDFRANTDYTIKIEVTGDVIKTYKEGKLIDELTDPTFSSGTIGFCQPVEEDKESIGQFSSIVVRSSAGKYLLQTNDNVNMWQGENMPAAINGYLQVNKNDILICKLGNVEGGIDRSTLTTATLGAFSNGSIADQYDYYICKGGEEEVWEPKFTNHGYRYIQVSGYPGELTTDDIVGKMIFQGVVDENAVWTQDFESSNELLNDILHATMWSSSSAIQFGIFLDCCNRDERGGWTGDAEASTGAMNYYYDMAAAIEQYLLVMRDTQHEDGYIDNIAPRQGERAGAIEEDIPWSSACVNITYDIYQATGDLSIVERQWESMDRFMDWCIATSNNPQLIENGDFTSDKDCWDDYTSLDASNADKPLFSSAFYYGCAVRMAYFAEQLELTEEKEFYTNLASDIKNSFNKRFLVQNADGVYYNRIAQAPNAVALFFGLCPDETVQKQVAAVLAQTVIDADYHPYVGVNGLFCIFDALCDNGYEEVAYKLATQNTAPSWGNNILNGATTSWEFWDDRGSKNHSFTGGKVEEYIFRHLVGLESLEPGFKLFSAKAPVIEGLTYFHSKITTVNGFITFDWNMEDSFSMQIDIPANTKAEVFIPLLDKTAETICVKEGDTVIFENGTSKDSQYIRYLREENGYLVFEVGSGKYTFTGTGGIG